MKLIVTIVNKDDSPLLVKKLTQGGFSSTALSSTGGFLKAENSTILVGVDEEKVHEVLTLIRSCCHSRTETIPAATEPPYYPAFPMDIVVGGATIFVVDVDRFERI